MTKENWVTVGKVACVSVTVAACVAGYYGVKAGIKFFNKNMAIKKVLTESRKVIEKSYVNRNVSLPYDEITEKIKTFEEELKKLNIESLSAFANWFEITIPYGKSKNGWNYKEINIPEYDSKKAAIAKNTEELNKTKVMDFYKELESLI